MLHNLLPLPIRDHSSIWSATTAARSGARPSSTSSATAPLCNALSHQHGQQRLGVDLAVQPVNETKMRARWMLGPASTLEAPDIRRLISAPDRTADVP